MLLHILTDEEIAGIMAALSNVRNDIKRLSDETKPDQRYLTDTQLTQELSLSKRTLANYRAKGEFGYYNLPGKILYAESEIDELPDFAPWAKNQKSQKSLIFRTFRVLRFVFVICLGSVN